MNLIKEEEGDLGHHTRYTSKRTVRWITDSYGYRKKESNRPRYEVVLIGQSETFGASLIQHEMLSEILEDQLIVEVYPFAPAGVNSFLKEKHSVLHPAEIVTVSGRERAIFELPPPKTPSVKTWGLYERIRNELRKMRENR